MATIRHHTRIDAPADEVWAVASDFGGLDRWFPGVDACTVDGDVRSVEVMGGAMVLEERLVTSDDELRRLQYALVGEHAPEHHIATLDVIEDGDGALVIYSTDVIPDAMGEIIDGSLAGGIQGLKEHCEG